MLSPRQTVAISLVAFGLSFLPQSPVAAPAGPLSVAKILDLFDTVETDPEAGKLLFAYLSGIGESTGVLVAKAGQFGADLKCTHPLTLGADSVQAALRRAGGAPDQRAATPVIIEDMLQRAGCE